MIAPVSVNDVNCTRCGAEVNQGCETPSGNPANGPHAAQVNKYWRAVAAAQADSE